MQQDPQTTPEQETPSIFPEVSVSDQVAFDKKIRNARGWLYAIAVIRFIGMVVQYVKYREAYLKFYMFSIDLSIVVVFVVLAAYTRKKPTFCLVAGLTLYLLVSGFLIYLSPETAWKGSIFKVFCILGLAQGVYAAKQAEDLRKIFSGS